MAERTCSIEGCEREHYCRGFCNPHYQRLRRGQDLSVPVPPRRMSRDGDCLVADCSRQAYSRGLCNIHYLRVRRYGDPDACSVASGDRNANWKGDEVSYGGAHRRVQSARGLASTHVCIDCGGAAEDWSLREGAGVLRTAKGLRYSADPSDYDPRCKPCHQTYDGTPFQRRSA